MGHREAKRSTWINMMVISGVAAGSLIGWENAANAAQVGEKRAVQQYLGSRSEVQPASKVEYSGGRAIVKKTSQSILQFQTREETYSQTGSHIGTRSVEVPSTKTVVEYVQVPKVSYVPYADPDNYPGVQKAGSSSSNTFIKQIPHADWIPYADPDNYPGVPKVNSVQTGSITRQVPRTDWIPYADPDNYPGVPKVSSVQTGSITRQVPRTDWIPDPNPLRFATAAGTTISGTTKTVISNSTSRGSQGGIPGAFVTTRTMTYRDMPRGRGR